MLFISRFIKKDQPYVIQIKSDTRRLTGYNLLPPFPFFPRFMNSSDNKATTRSGIRKYQFKNFFIKREYALYADNLMYAPPPVSPPVAGKSLPNPCLSR